MENKKNQNVTIFEHPLIKHKTTILRSETTSNKVFRQLIEEITMLMCYEALRDLPLEDVKVKTPITETTQKMIKGKKLAIVPILRAGLGMVDGILQMVPIGFKHLTVCPDNAPVRRIDKTKNGNIDGINALIHRFIPSTAPRKAVLLSNISINMPAAEIIAMRRFCAFIRSPQRILCFTGKLSPENPYTSPKEAMGGCRS